jgi:hypothetical protein
LYSNLQRWEILREASTLRLDSLPADLRPIVQVIDDGFTNRHPGLLYETRFEEHESENRNKALA